MDGFFIAHPVYDRRGIFVDSHFFGATQHIERCMFERQAFFFRNHRTARQDGDIFQHFFTAVAESGSFHSRNLQRSAQTVYNQGRKRFRIDIFCDNQQWFAGLNALLEDGKKIFDGRYFFVVDKNLRIFEFHLHAFGIGHEIRRDISAIELHPFYDIYIRIGTFGFFDGNHAFFADFLHGFGNEFTDGFIAIRRDLGHIFDFLQIVADFYSLASEVFHHFGHGDVYSALQIHRISAGGYVLQSYPDDGLSQQGSGGCSVARIVIGFGSHFLYQLGAHVLEGILQFYFFCHGHPVFRNLGSAVFFVDDHIAAFRAQSYFYCIRQRVHSFFE